MNRPTQEPLEDYYREAASWSLDREKSQRSTLRVAWIIAAAATTVAVLEAIALIVLMPLKTVEPYTLLVDRNTGYVQALRPINPEQIDANTALTQSFLVQYVIAREGFAIDTIQDNYRKTALWSGEVARTQYLAAMQPGHPDNPLVRYPRSSTLEVRVKSVSPIAPNVAMVRFDTQRRDANGSVHPPNAWAAVIRYTYTGEPMSLEDRFINPLGFRVLRYRRDPEALPASADPQANPSGNAAQPAPERLRRPRPSPIAPQPAPGPEDPV